MWSCLHKALPAFPRATPSSNGTCRGALRSVTHASGWQGGRGTLILVGVPGQLAPPPPSGRRPRCKRPFPARTAFHTRKPTIQLAISRVKPHRHTPFSWHPPNCGHPSLVPRARPDTPPGPYLHTFSDIGPDTSMQFYLAFSSLQWST